MENERESIYSILTIWRQLSAINSPGVPVNRLRILVEQNFDTSNISLKIRW